MTVERRPTFGCSRGRDWITAPSASDYDFVILPGTKDTMGDLAWLRRQGLDDVGAGSARRGATVIGVCGGLQMLGDRIDDPDGLESTRGSSAGLGLLPVETTLEAEKTTVVRRARTPGGASFAAYEIHLGVTRARRALPPFAICDDGATEGMRGDRVLGTYLHGAFEDAAVCEEVFGVPMPAAGGEGRGISAARPSGSNVMDAVWSQLGLS